LRIWWCFSASTAKATAKYVLPVPAGPIANVIVVVADRLDISGLPLRPGRNPPGRLHVDAAGCRRRAIALSVTSPSTSLT